ncbi:MAG: hypothetical protein Kow0062_04800 [Acidobacteriota bacterium]|nr:MAG: VCBS repeat-containing protein [Acidobacteriota bacterium]
MLPVLVALAASVVLPAEPRIVTAGDIDADGTSEIVVLVVFAEHGTVTDLSSPAPGQVELDVRPAIEERRELWVLRVDGRRLAPVVEPLEVGPELLALAAAAPDQRVWALRDDGPALLEFERDERGRPTGVGFRQIVAVEPLMARSRVLALGYPFLHDFDGVPPAEMLVPVSSGLVIVSEQGVRASLDAPLREVDSGSSGRMRVTLPRVTDVDGDGTLDLLDVAGLSGDWSETRVALRRGLGRWRFSGATIWTLTPLLEETPDERRKGLAREAWDVLDLDGDGELEFALAISRVGAETIREGLRLIRGEPRRIELHELARDGTVGRKPERTLELDGHAWWLRHPGGWVSPFRDLDGDRRPELLALRIAFGYFGALRAIAFGSVKATLRPVVCTIDPDGRLHPLEGSVPEARFRMDLEDLDLSRFRSFPGDLDGDGRLDMVDVDRDEVRITWGRPGPRFPDDPDRVIPLGAAVDSFDQVRFLDVDGRGALDLLAIEPQKAGRDEDDRPSRPVRLELITLDTERR